MTKPATAGSPQSRGDEEISMIRIQLFKYNRAIVDETHESADAAYKAIDAIINAVHKGEHGTGVATLYADHVNQAGLFTGVFVRALDIIHPPRVPTA